MEAVTLKNVSTDALDVAYDEDGDLDGWPVVLLHGFPYDIYAYDDVTPRLISRCRGWIRHTSRHFECDDQNSPP
jgi:pimeloyl-ACP methyl ester carboxylesterase